MMEKDKPELNMGTVAGRPDKVPMQAQFPVQSLEGVLAEIRRAGGTGKLEINFKNGRARGEATFNGFGKKD